tara:strand:- start:5215 stop:7956 length:2742 start_codon:yes stop_codon:yes gene_type:complete
MERLYIVTLWRHEDLEDLYQEMEDLGIELVKKREMSRNTHYRMTESQVDNLKSDSRVRGIELHPDELPVNVKPTYDPYTLSNKQFFKDDLSSPSNAANYYDWGKLFCAGTEAQRDKGNWGSNSGDRVKTDTVTIFSDGKDVDIVIVDNRASYDCDEWKSPSSGNTRYVMYDWYNELRQYVSGLPSGSYNSNYLTNANNPDSHATHVMSTAGGQHYGWAREANLYNLNFLSNSPLGMDDVLDLLRAFHKHKPINSTTGRRNPTVTNHSYGYLFGGSSPRSTHPNQLTQYISNGVTYSSSNPNPSGWDAKGLSNDFDINVRLKDEPSLTLAWTSDVEDAINDGVVLIGAAGNSNYYIVDPDHDLYDDKATFEYNDYSQFLNGSSGSYSLYTRRGSSPVANGMISVGAINATRFNRRTDFTGYGPGIDVYAPGHYIIGAYNSSGTQDGKYGGNNYYRAISGTSMASPQVCGIAACLASGRERFTQDDMLDWIDQHSHDLGSDGNTELSFDGEHNSGIGEYERNIGGAGLNYSTSKSIIISTYLAGITTAFSCNFSTTQLGDGTTDDFLQTEVFGMNNADQFVGYSTREEIQPKKPEEREFYYYEGDRIQVRWAPKRCWFDLSSSNTSNGWSFGKPLRWGGHGDNFSSSIPEEKYWFDRSNRNYASIVTGNPTINLVKGDILIIDTNTATSSHPFWIKSALGSGSTNALTGRHILNNGGQGNVPAYSAGVSAGTGTFPNSLTTGQIMLHTQDMNTGTYYYQCGNHSSMNGQIVIHSRSSAFGSGVYFKTAKSMDTTSDLVTGSGFQDVINQGAIEWRNQTSAEQDAIMTWQTRPGDAGTYYLQSGSQNWAYTFHIEARPTAGNFWDLSCNKDGPTKFINCASPRQSSGNIDKPQLGRRNKTSTKVKYPRRSNIVRGS